MSAAYEGLHSIVQLLFERGFDLNESNENGSTALMLAAQQGHIETVKFLLSRGANVNHRNIQKATPLSQTAKNGHVEMVKLLLDNDAEYNTVNHVGQSPLFNAAYLGHLDVVKLLLTRPDIDTNSTYTKNDQYEGFNVLDAALAFGHLDIAEVLELRGVIPNKIHSDNRSSVASQNPHWSINEEERQRRSSSTASLDPMTHMDRATEQGGN